MIPKADDSTQTSAYTEDIMVSVVGVRWFKSLKNQQLLYGQSLPWLQGQSTHLVLFNICFLWPHNHRSFTKTQYVLDALEYAA